MGLRRRISSLIFKRKAEQISSTFIENGSMLLEEFMDSCNGRYNIPIRNFSAEQILRATNNFDQHHLIRDDAPVTMYKGSMEERLILVKKFGDFQRYRSEAIRDIVITSQMRSHKNVARLFGCCLEFKGPALVYEYSGDVPLKKLLIDKDKASGLEDSSLGWKSRLRIANEIANAVAYLHIALSKRVVNRDLNLNNIMIDQHGVARLFDFSLSISISPEEEATEANRILGSISISPEEEAIEAARIFGTLGYFDPECFTSGLVTEKIDVYSFGIILLQLLTGREIWSIFYHKEDEMFVVDFVKNQFTKILDPLILVGGGGGGRGIEQEQQLRDFLVSRPSFALDPTTRKPLDSSSSRALPVGSTTSTSVPTPAPPARHSMVTRAQAGIYKPKHLAFISSVQPPDPSPCLAQYLRAQRYNIPIRNFSAKEILRATDYFDEHQVILANGFFKLYKGSLEERKILVKKFKDGSGSHLTTPLAIRDIVITLQMNSQKNVVRLFGYCLEFEGPALVYDYSGNEPLDNFLYNRDGASEHEDRSLSWKSRLRIAKEIANVVVYLHTALSRPVVNRDLKPKNIMIDQNGVAKLFDFSLSISIPLGESRVGTAGDSDVETNIASDLHSLNSKDCTAIERQKITNSLWASHIKIIDGWKWLSVCAHEWYNIPIRNFSAKEILRATDYFDEHQVILADGFFKLYKGSLEERKILVKKFKDGSGSHLTTPLAIHDIVITLQMNRHKNVVRLFGYCLEFEGPALVYDYSGDEPLENFLYNRDGASEHEDRSLRWKSRLRIAKEIANVVVYLHTALSRPVVNRDLKPKNIMIDQNGVAKLFDFSLSISIPLGESRVEDDNVIGTAGFLDPEYCQSGYVTQKSDVFSFGILLLVLLTGKQPFSSYLEEDEVYLQSYVKKYIDKDQFTNILDPKILEGRRGGIEQEQQLQAFVTLALKCVELKGEDRPEMIDVAKELSRIERFVHP
ncbi:hypothetical protein F0562_020826 [Nyssa sinensis]|uniref:non-specific serine/threonine protein kinase n=1 Tax=Nyssa sinensis TaxID=561372 RepID=A0A5J5BRG2_9ASTE|nr:hypothetical protein F0562_020826 [Nyssa sinensis]